jgi:hypothetical protein
MPTLGPDKRPCYYPHEAFDGIGKAHFGKDWKLVFSAEAAREYPEEPNWALSQNQNPDAEHISYSDQVGVGTYMGIQGLASLVANGRILAWRFLDVSFGPVKPYWEVVGRDELDKKGACFDLLIKDIVEGLSEGGKPSGELLFDKARFDDWLDWRENVVISPNLYVRPSGEYAELRSSGEMRTRSNRPAIVNSGNEKIHDYVGLLQLMLEFQEAKNPLSDNQLAKEIGMLQRRKNRPETSRATLRELIRIFKEIKILT